MFSCNSIYPLPRDGAFSAHISGNHEMWFLFIFTPTHLVFGFLIFVYSSANTTIYIALMNHKNTAQQLFNISEDIYKSYYHIVFLEVCRAYQIIPDGLFISKKPNIYIIIIIITFILSIIILLL